ncbi:MAG: hypothetical protein QNK20_16765 [Aureibaculum sp.]|nr:hypothetical protein [Aureibaculum sp.]
MKPRFEPTQEVWKPYGNRAILVDIMQVFWIEGEIEYEIQTLSNIGHQEFETYTDTEGEKCLLFETKEECDQYIVKASAVQS